jgi:2-polyprenyl-6-hydroxyphenyl methylase/3-demethylubiquinone-9 3-methyltransferase
MVIPAARLTYPPQHWLRANDPESVLAAGAGQQALTYSRIKNAHLFDLLGDLSGASLLDFGCGAGYFAVEAAKRRASFVTGVDALPSALAAASLLARRNGVAGRTAFIACEQPVFSPQARFTVICLRDVIEHVVDDLGLLERLAGHLAPGGRLVLATQNRWSLNYLLEGGFRRLCLGQRGWLGWDATHVRFYSPKSLAALLRRAGLRPYAWRSAYIIPHKLPGLPGSQRPFRRIEALAALDRPLGRIFPFCRLGWSVMVGATA